MSKEIIMIKYLKIELSKNKKKLVFLILQSFILWLFYFGYSHSSVKDDFTKMWTSLLVIALSVLLMILLFMILNIVRTAENNYNNEVKQL